MKKLLIVVILTLTGCLSADNADEKWSAYLEDHNACETADDCVVIYPSCPLGCWAAVSKEHREDAEAKADQLAASYERGGRACAYDCASHGAPACEAGACTVTEAPLNELACVDANCGDSCTVCTDDDCPDEFCQSDGRCTADEPVCM